MQAGVLEALRLRGAPPRGSAAQRLGEGAPARWPRGAPRRRTPGSSRPSSATRRGCLPGRPAPGAPDRGAPARRRPGRTARRASRRGATWCGWTSRIATPPSTSSPRRSFPPDEPNPPYDDVAWTWPLLYGVDGERIDDEDVLAAAMTRRRAEVPAGTVDGGAGARARRLPARRPRPERAAHRPPAARRPPGRRRRGAVSARRRRLPGGELGGAGAARRRSRRWRRRPGCRSPQWPSSPRCAATWSTCRGSASSTPGPRPRTPAGCATPSTARGSPTSWSTRTT
jgi:hypothetical protein